MAGNLFVLIGIGFFIKIFFSTAQNIKKSEEVRDLNKMKKNSLVHILLGISFVILGTLIVKM